MTPAETIVAISTPPGEGGVGMVRLSGPRALDIGRQLFCCRPPLGRRIRRVEYGQVRAGGRTIDTGLAWVLKGPRSYTGEDTVEISCHGSILVLETLVQEAIQRGACLAAPGEFTRRAFLNGRLDLLQAEAVIDLIQSGSRSHLDHAYGQASGRLSALVRQLKERLVRALSLVEVGLDFAEEDIDEITRQQVLAEVEQSLADARSLAETFAGSQRRQQGFLVAIVGRPNTGKSTLLNALLGEERAIVTPVPGTTRDLVEGRTLWSGEIVRLVDTAGLRASTDPVEEEGVARARRAAASADLLLILLDASNPWAEDDRELVHLARTRPGLLVLNKTDRMRRLHLPEEIADSFFVVEISALTGSGLHALRERARALLPRPTLVDGVGITRQRHRDALLRAIDGLHAAQTLILQEQLDECIVADLQEALRALGEMLGEDVSEQVLDRIFSDFCIGK